MTFHPEANQELLIGGAAYRVAEHPVAPGMPYGQEGRAAVVYKLVAEGGDARALKVFKPRFRVPALVVLAEAAGGLRGSARPVGVPPRRADPTAKHALCCESTPTLFMAC